MTGGSPDAQVETRPTNLHVVPDEISAMTPDRSDVPTEADNQGCVYMDAETDPSTPQGGGSDSRFDDADSVDDPSSNRYCENEASQQALPAATKVGGTSTRSTGFDGRHPVRRAQTELWPSKGLSVWFEQPAWHSNESAARHGLDS